MSERYEDSKLYRIRHSAAHIMAEAVLELFPDGRVAIGPPIEDGFYYDFEMPRQLTEEDFTGNENRKRQNIKGKNSVRRRKSSTDGSKKRFPKQTHKIQL